MKPRHPLQTLLAIALPFVLATLHGAQFFTGKPADIIAQIPPPPAERSLADMADIETMLQVQKDRSPAQVERALSIVDQDGMSPGMCVFGPEFTPENLPKTAAFFKQAKEVDLRSVVNAAKDHWKRMRPHLRGAGVKPCVPVPSSDSYPSGHSAARVLFSILYGAALPEYAPLFDDDAREAMWCRVLGGAHYPTDTQGGRIMGELVGAEMLKNETTRKAIAEIRAEIRAFLTANPEARKRAEEMLRRRFLNHGKTESRKTIH